MSFIMGSDLRCHVGKSRYIELNDICVRLEHDAKSEVHGRKRGEFWGRKEGERRAHLNAQRSLCCTEGGIIAQCLDTSAARPIPP
mmetsp:Transcript_54680/g.163401  ORF Transcript_54680/g.163401 Transcript_54680/m.163401 type:complete len:85 (-) Transcript_54680:856-1110(-)